jgi:hypothetical protein
LLTFGDAEQIVGRERNQRACHRQLVRDVVDRSRVNSTVRFLSTEMKLLVILPLLLATCSPRVSQTPKTSNATPTVQPSEFQVLIPKDTWGPIFFKEIDQRRLVGNLPNLRTGPVPSGDLAVRVWIGFGLTALQGFDLKRSSGQWSGLYLAGIYSGLPKNKYQKQLPPPKSGWDSLWQQLTAAEILSLPDARSIDCGGGALDGVCYVVETNLDNRYRTYMYDNPQFAKCQQAKQMVEISRILFTEFGL